MISKPQLISLTTDFGTRDFRTGALQACILKHAPNVQFVDLSHEVPVFDLVQAAFMIKNGYPFFPHESIHLAWVFNAGEDNGILLAYFESCYFILPDNGLLNMICDEQSPEYILRISEDCYQYRERIAAAVFQITSGEDMMALYDKLENPVRKINVSPVYQKDRIQTKVSYIDRYGNLILNIMKEPFNKIAAGRSFSFHTKTHDVISHFTTDEVLPVNGGFYLYFSDAGFMTLALCGSHAATTLDIHVDDNLQIIFE